MTEVPQAPEQTGVPTCYRHPGRETHVRCVRCDRYICPDCMIEASVGFQCPECVREGNQGMRQAEGRFGGRPTGSPFVCWVLIALNVAVFVLQYASGSPVRIEREYGLFTYSLALDDEYYRMFTSAFLHSGLPHLLLNMWALYIVGPALEVWLGRARFLTLYLLSAFGGSVLVYLTDSNAIGASGAIFGLFGAFLVAARRQNLDARPIAFIIGINLVLTFVIAGISWQGHIGGLIVGTLVGIAFAYAPRERRALVQWGSAVLFTLALAALTVFHTVQLTG